mgnify:CR=1 FL=1
MENIIHTRKFQIALNVLQLLSIIGFIIGILGIILITAGVIKWVEIYPISSFYLF